MGRLRPRGRVWIAPALVLLLGASYTSGQLWPDGRPAPDASAVRYGDHERQTLDVWLAKSSGRPAPVVVFFHGGGFLGGDKRSVPGSLLATCLERGVSVVSANYRLSTQAPYPAPMLDGARVVQFLRSRAGRWNIDPERIALVGNSAGGGIALWVGFHDDLADPNSPDPLARESTRVAAVAGVGAQTSYDPRTIKQWVGGRAHEHPALPMLFGLRPNEYDAPRAHRNYEDSSAITHVSPGDPPAFLYFLEPGGPVAPTERQGKGIHHPVFGLKLSEALVRVGGRCELRHYEDDRVEGIESPDAEGWLARRLCDELGAGAEGSSGLQGAIGGG